jgi:hypothetical protein
MPDPPHRTLVADRLFRLLRDVVPPRQQSLHLLYFTLLYRFTLLP